MKPIFSRIATACQHLANMSAVTDGTQVEGENSASSASGAPAAFGDAGASASSAAFGDAGASVSSAAFGDAGASVSSAAFGDSGASSAFGDTNSTTVTDSKKTV